MLEGALLFFNHFSGLFSHDLVLDLLISIESKQFSTQLFQDYSKKKNKLSDIPYTYREPITEIYSYILEKVSGCI